jgi:hydrogenase expression/formation protein HypC
MCISYPARVRTVEPDGMVLVEWPGGTRRVTLLALDEPVAPGDWLLVHSGIALGRLDPADARDRLRLIYGDSG